jgi:4-amino-4-deoxy-L-arabinose transferase-like glycosyltransferase
MAKSENQQYALEKQNRVILYSAIILIAAALFFPFLGNVHLFDWDEINFAEAAREMLASGNYLTVQIDFRPFLQKPPLFIWLQAMSMAIFGVNEFAARFPNALLGVFQLMLLYHIGKKWHDKSFGILWVIIFGSSILPFFYIKSAIIDPWFNFFIFLGFYYFIEYLRLEQQRIYSIILSAFFIGLAILTKGPVALLVFLLVTGILWLFERKQFKIRMVDIVAYISTLTIVGALWFVVQVYNGNYQMVVDFIIYQIKLFSTQDAGHGGFFLYHFVVLFFGVFPASVFAIAGLSPKIFKSNKSLIYRLMFIFFWVVLILFTIVKTKIVHYSSLAYFPMTYLAVLTIQYRFKKNRGISTPQFILLFFIATIVLIAVGLLQYIGLHANELASNEMIKDAFARGNLQAEVNWSGFEFLVGFLPLIGLTIALFMRKRAIHFQIYSIAFFTAAFVFLAQLVLVPKIEKYSQNAAIEFFQEHADENADIETIGYKSYAQFYYGKRKLENQANETNEAYLQRILKGNTDRTVYAVSKVDRWPRMKADYPDFKELYTKNGFVFLVREKNK